MSRIIVFGLDNNPVGTITANCNRGWILLGHTGVSAGGQTTISLPGDSDIPSWLQLGRKVLIERPPLPAWVGVIDTPWKATLPVELTLYNAEYLFSLRSAERSVAVLGPLPSVIQEMIRLASEQEEMFVQIGNIGQLNEPFPKVIEQALIWNQMIKTLEEAGYEMVLRPQRDNRNHLTIYADVGVGLGFNTEFLLQDGEAGNMRVIDATVNGKIINRVKGVSGESTEEAQLESDLLEDQASQDIYRTRSEVVKFRNVTQLSTLNQYTQVYLNASANPYIDLTVEVMDVGNAFANLRVGNWLQVHASQVYLPGGFVGWRGDSRILAMVYDEDQNVVQLTLRGAL